MSSTNPFSVRTAENNSFCYSGYIRPIDPVTGAAVAGSMLSLLQSLTLTYRDAKTGTIINSRNAQNVLNANQVTVDDDGLVVWNALAADAVIVTASKPGDELHIATFEGRYPAPDTVRGCSWDVYVYVRNLGKAR